MRIWTGPNREYEKNDFHERVLSKISEKNYGNERD